MGTPDSGATFPRDLQYAKFCAYGFLKNLRFFEPFLILFFLEKGISFLQIGTLYAFREIAVNILEIPTGAVADALGRRRIMVFSFASYLISFLIFWRSSAFGFFVLGMFLFSFGEAFRTGTHKAMIFTYLRLTGNENFKTEYYGHTRGWSQIGSAVSAVIAAAVVILTGNYTAVFLFSTIPYVLDLVLMTTYPAALDGGKRGATRQSIRDAFTGIWKSLVATAREPAALKVVASASFFGGVHKGMKDYLQPLITALAISIPLAGGMAASQREAVLVGAVYTVIYILTAISSRSAGRMARALATPERAMNWELAIGLGFGVAVGVASLLGWAAVPVVLFLAIFVVQNLRKPVGVSVVSDRVPENILATALSVESQLQSLFAAIIALLIGFVADLSSGSVGGGILVASVVGLAVLPLLWIRPAVAGRKGGQQGASAG